MPSTWETIKGKIYSRLAHILRKNKSSQRWKRWLRIELGDFYCRDRGGLSSSDGYKQFNRHAIAWEVVRLKCCSSPRQIPNPGNRPTVTPVSATILETFETEWGEGLYAKAVKQSLKVPKTNTRRLGVKPCQLTLTTRRVNLGWWIKQNDTEHR